MQCQNGQVNYRTNSDGIAKKCWMQLRHKMIKTKRQFIHDMQLKNHFHHHHRITKSCKKPNIAQNTIFVQMALGRITVQF